MNAHKLRRQAPNYAEITITDEMILGVDFRVLLPFRWRLAEQIREDFGNPDMEVWGVIAGRDERTAG